MLEKGLHVGQQLAGMGAAGQPVDDRYASVCRQPLDRVMGEGAHHDRVAHFAQHPGGIFHRLAAAKLGVAGREEHRATAAFEHRGLERNPGAGR